MDDFHLSISGGQVLEDIADGNAFEAVESRRTDAFRPQSVRGIARPVFFEPRFVFWRWFSFAEEETEVTG